MHITYIFCHLSKLVVTNCLSHNAYLWVEARSKSLYNTGQVTNTFHPQHLNSPAPKDISRPAKISICPVPSVEKQGFPLCLLTGELDQ